MLGPYRYTLLLHLYTASQSPKHRLTKGKEFDLKLSDFSWHLEGSETAPAMKTRQGGLSPARPDVAKTPAVVFMAKRGVTNSQAFKENLQSDYAISLRMVVNEPPN